MKTYLSIDLDYWNGCTRKSINAFFAHVFQLRLPIWIAPLHHQLLPHINRHPCDVLINVDAHSDICDKRDDDDIDLSLNEGTWANFVEWQQRGTFIWRYPGPECLYDCTGYCHCQKSPFEESCTDWAHVHKQQSLRRIPWDTIKAVGVTLSIAWIERRHNPLVPITKALGIYHWLKWDSTEQEKLAKPFCKRARNGDETV